MTTQTAYITSAHIEREARKLLALRDQWRYARNRQTGVAFVAIPSPCCDKRCPAGPEAHSHVRHVHPFGLGCDCPATQLWGARSCKHRAAVMLANAEDQQAEASVPIVLVDVRDERIALTPAGEQTVREARQQTAASVPTHGVRCLTDMAAQAVNDAIMAESRRPSYADLFPKCQTDGCGDVSDTHDGFCDRCASDREFAARLASRRAAVGV